ncbi:hypothetical protein [Oscillibacter sp.]|uniref:hypothetical protein n=1 Tax=Oscillibacter sp. TaxID=1945593 RepID=UPI002D80D2CD|nr:hypothetical protein [Oscillibacter sp.]
MKEYGLPESLADAPHTQLMNWAELYDNRSFDAKKMMVAQFVKAVYGKRGFALDIEINVSFDEFQTLCLDAEAEDSGKAPDVLAYTEKEGQAI